MVFFYLYALNGISISWLLKDVIATFGLEVTLGLEVF
jgi:hypothetical protein